MNGVNDIKVIIEKTESMLSNISGADTGWIWVKDTDEKFGDHGHIEVKDTDDMTGSLVAYVHPHGNFKTFLARKQAYSHHDAEFIASCPDTIRQLLNFIKQHINIPTSV